MAEKATNITTEKPVKATVTSFRNKGDDLIAITKNPDYKGSITVSLVEGVWSGPHPKKGDVVRLEQVHLTGRGWRSENGRLWRLSDEQS